MGCGGSTQNASQPQGGAKDQAGSTKDAKPAEKPAKTGTGEPAKAESGVPAELSSSLKELSALLGTHKEDRICVHAENKNSLRISVWDAKGNSVWTSCLTEQQLVDHKDLKTLTKWGTFFQSLQKFQTNGSGFSIKKKSGNAAKVVAVFPIADTKKISFQVPLDNQGSEPATLQKFFVDPMVACWSAGGDKSKPDSKYTENMKTMYTARQEAGELQAQVTKLQGELDPLREEARNASTSSTQMASKVRSVERKMQFVKSGGLPELYSPDWPQAFALHTPHAPQHSTTPIEPNQVALQQIKVNFLKEESPDWVSKDTAPPPLEPEENNLKQLLDAAGPDSSHQAIVTALKSLDDWEFDSLALSEATNGCPLFITGYALFQKWGLVHHFKMEEQVVINFLQAIEAMYHNSSPFHTSTHAAEALQAMHHIMRSGKLYDVQKLTPADVLSCFIAAMIIDLDHPGVNNNFHIRTSSYLAILYNDRAVLEYHAVAQWSALMKEPKFNIFATLPEADWRLCRDNVAEMVINTDRGGIFKLISQFKRRMGEDGVDWTVAQKRDDARLALSIALNMADTSYFGRKLDMYTAWANKRVEEEYSQGAKEQSLGLDPSPFMMRGNHNTHFIRGQQMMFEKTVLPLWEVGTSLFSGMQQVTRQIKDNQAALSTAAAKTALNVA